MKKVPLKKLALTAETIRNLTAAEMRGVGGGLNTVILTTTHSITSACNTITVRTLAGTGGGDVE
jgi:hypothetical protein